MHAARFDANRIIVAHGTAGNCPAVADLAREPHDRRLGPDGLAVRVGDERECPVHVALRVAHHFAASMCEHHAGMDLRVALMLLVVGCYDPTPTEGARCSVHKECPAELMCSFGTCVSEPLPCVAIENGAGKLTIPRVDEPIVVDGNLADWPTCFVSVDRASAGLVRDLDGGGKYTPGRFSLAADAEHVYLVAEVQGVPPLGDQPLPAVYKNNAISVYFDGDGSFPAAAYGPDAVQIVVDHANRTQAFRSGSLTTVPVDHAVTTNGSTFVIEMAVTPRTFGITKLGSTIGFDIGLVGGDGMIMTSELVWFQACKPPACVCTNMDSAPYCDARQFGTATLPL